MHEVRTTMKSARRKYGKEFLRFPKKNYDAIRYNIAQRHELLNPVDQ